MRESFLSPNMAEKDWIQLSGDDGEGPCILLSDIGLTSTAAPHANKEVGDPMISPMAEKLGVSHDALGLDRLDEDPEK